MVKDIRIPFEEAASEPRLLKPWLTQLSMPQLVAIKVIYGCPLDDHVKDDRGWTEMDYYYASQGSGDFTDLGYLKKVRPVPYTPQEYRETWACWGIRAGKTDRFASTVVAYEAVCGGHEAYGRKGRPIVCFQIAQDTQLAKYSLHSIKATLESMAFLKTDSTESWIKNVTADRIELKNGVTISVKPPTIKAVRGYDSPVAVLDEVAVWYQEADSANPDFAIYSQVSSRQAQFPFSKIIGISSPWNRAGLLYSRYEAGTNGSKLLCPECRVAGGLQPDCKACHSLRTPHQNRLILYSTTALSNPIIGKEWLVAERNKDPKAFERECLARFQDSLSGFLNADLIEKARAHGVIQRPVDGRNFYIAAIDPAFRQDAFGFTIVHADPDKGIVQDYVGRWKATGGVPLNPATVIPEIAAVLKQFNLRQVFSDQYNLEALQFIANQFGFTIEEVTFSSESKAKIYGNLQQLLNQGRLSILDDQETINELKGIEKKLSQAGTVQISAPDGMHDDMATVLAIAAYEAVWLLPRKEAEKKGAGTIIERIQQHVAAKAKFIHSRAHEYGYADDF